MKYKTEDFKVGTGHNAGELPEELLEIMKHNSLTLETMKTEMAEKFVPKRVWFEEIKK